jgi:hypothetical protein
VSINLQYVASLHAPYLRIRFFTKSSPGKEIPYKKSSLGENLSYKEFSWRRIFLQTVPQAKIFLTKSSPGKELSQQKSRGGKLEEFSWR